MISCVCKQNCRFIKINSIAIMCLYCTCMCIIINNNNNNNNNNKLRDIFNDFCHSACLAPQLEGWSRDRTRPAAPNWVLGKPAAFDLSVTSTLNAQIFQEACVTAGSAGLAAQIRKHRVNDERMQGSRLDMYPSCGGDVRMLGY